MHGLKTSISEKSFGTRGTAGNIRHFGTRWTEQRVGGASEVLTFVSAAFRGKKVVHLLKNHAPRVLEFFCR